MEKYNPKFIKDVVQKVACFSKDRGIRQHHKKILCILYYILRWRGEDRLQNFYALAYWKTDGAMLVQLSIKKLFLIFSASCSVESKGGRISCAVKVLSECAESEIRHNKHMATSHSVSMLVTPKSAAFQVIFEK